MTEPVDYFANHRYKRRFPWRLYHGPIIGALRDVVQRSAGKPMLNLGSGPFFELAELGEVTNQLTICDIDRRAVELAQQLHGSRLHRCDVIEPNAPLPYADASFDLVVSMDVVEHVTDPLPWLREALRILTPEGTLFLTTPNYASYSLRALEATALELIARKNGFSRKLLHPSKMTPARIGSLLNEAGASDVALSVISFGWVLALTARRTALPL